MTDEQGSSGSGVGSVVDEAAKLLAALQDWARDNATRQGAAGASAAAGMADRPSDINAHLATRGEDCGPPAAGGEVCVYCPVCEVIHAVRATPPEVRAHLPPAASALLQAAAG